MVRDSQSVDEDCQNLDETAGGRILAVTEEELQRIILDIHDGPVQELFAALSQISLMQQQLAQCACSDRKTLQMLLDRIANLVESSLWEIKTFLGTFRPPEFQRRSLLSALKGLIIQHEELTGNRVDLEVHGELPVVALPVKIALYRILQEALSNSYRHAGVDRHSVRLWTENNYIYLEVMDEGVGFIPPPLTGPEATEQAEHIGLRGMRERVALLGGSFQLHSAPGQGTRVLVEIPYRV